MIVRCPPRKFIVCYFSITYLYLSVSCAPSPSLFFLFQKVCFNDCIFDVRHKYRSDGVGVWLPPPPPFIQSIVVTESTRVVILSACATVRDGYVLCVWRVQVFDVEHTAVGFHPHSHPPEPVWMWERVRFLPPPHNPWKLSGGRVRNTSIPTLTPQDQTGREMWSLSIFCEHTCSMNSSSSTYWLSKSEDRNCEREKKNFAS
jgi:hypothetical protein